MKMRYRLLAAAGIGAMALGVSGPALAAPATGGEQLAVSDLGFDGHGPGTYESTVGVRMYNTGTVTHEGMSVLVLPPAGVAAVGSEDQDGIGDCAPTTVDGRAGLVCQVTDRGPDTVVRARITMRATVPLSNPGEHGSVVLRAADGASLDAVGFSVEAFDEDAPTQEVDFVTTASDTALVEGSDGRYHGTVTISVTNDSTEPVDRTTLGVLPPLNTTISASDSAGLDCYVVSGDTKFFVMPHGLRCGVPLGEPGSTGSYTFQITATTPDTEGTLGVARLLPYRSGYAVVDPNHGNADTFAVTFGGEGNR